MLPGDLGPDDLLAHPGWIRKKLRIIVSCKIEGFGSIPARSGGGGGGSSMYMGSIIEHLKLKSGARVLQFDAPGPTVRASTVHLNFHTCSIHGGARLGFEYVHRFTSNGFLNASSLGAFPGDLGAAAPQQGGLWGGAE